jgi:hypothetical protein
VTFVFYLCGDEQAPPELAGLEWVMPPHSLELERQVRTDRRNAFLAYA